MNDAEVARITDERLAAYRRRMLENHATPLVMLGVGRDHRSGEINLCVTGDADMGLVLGLLRFAARQVEAGMAREAGP
jgi:hypothetical protein